MLQTAIILINGITEFLAYSVEKKEIVCSIYNFLYFQTVFGFVLSAVVRLLDVISSSMSLTSITASLLSIGSSSLSSNVSLVGCADFHGPHSSSKHNWRLKITRNITLHWRIEDFPQGESRPRRGRGVDFQGGYVSKFLYMEMKEYGSLGGACARHAP